MKTFWLGVAALALVLGWCGVAWSEREPESRDKATYVVTGRVTAVYSRQTTENDHYVVTLQIETVERGENVQAGRTLFVTSFRRKPNAPLVPAASGHSRPPKEGQMIRAFVNDRRGANEGVYPDWYDVIEEAPQADNGDQSANAKPPSINELLNKSLAEMRRDQSKRDFEDLLKNQSNNQSPPSDLIQRMLREVQAQAEQQNNQRPVAPGQDLPQQNQAVQPIVAQPETDPPPANALVELNRPDVSQQVSSEEVGQAWLEADAARLADLVLKMLEWEASSGRRLRTFESENLALVAMRLAQLLDVPTAERLEAALAGYAASHERLREKPWRAPVLRPLDVTLPENFVAPDEQQAELARQLLDSLRRAVASAIASENVVALQSLHEALGQIDDVPAASREALRQRIAAALEALDESGLVDERSRGALYLVAEAHLHTVEELPLGDAADAAHAADPRPLANSNAREPAAGFALTNDSARRTELGGEIPPLPPQAEQVFTTKYLHLRERFRTQFMFHGHVIDERTRSKITFGDGGLNMGFALLTFAGEAKLLRDKGIDSSSSEEAIRILLRTFDYLDRDAEIKIYGAGNPAYVEETGYFVRDGIDATMTLPGFAVVSDMLGNADPKEPKPPRVQDAMSLDQIVHMLMGWWAVKNWSGDEQNVWLARNQTARVMHYLLRRQFVITYPYERRWVSRGAECRPAAGFLSLIGGSIVGQDYYARATSRIRCDICAGSGETRINEPNFHCIICSGSGKLKLVLGSGKYRVVKYLGQCATCNGSGRVRAELPNVVPRVLPCVVCQGDGGWNVPVTLSHPLISRAIVGASKAITTLRNGEMLVAMESVIPEEAHATMVQPWKMVLDQRGKEHFVNAYAYNLLLILVSMDPHSVDDPVLLSIAHDTRHPLAVLLREAASGESISSGAIIETVPRVFELMMHLHRSCPMEGPSENVAEREWRKDNRWERCIDIERLGPLEIKDDPALFNGLDFLSLEVLMRLTHKSHMIGNQPLSLLDRYWIVRNETNEPITVRYRMFSDVAIKWYPNQDELYTLLIPPGESRFASPDEGGRRTGPQTVPIDNTLLRGTRVQMWVSGDQSGENYFDDAELFFGGEYTNHAVEPFLTPIRPIVRDYPIEGRWRAADRIVSFDDGRLVVQHLQQNKLSQFIDAQYQFDRASGVLTQQYPGQDARTSQVRWQNADAFVLHDATFNTETPYTRTEEPSPSAYPIEGWWRAPDTLAEFAADGTAKLWTVRDNKVTQSVTGEYEYDAFRCLLTQRYANQRPHVSSLRWNNADSFSYFSPSRNREVTFQRTDERVNDPPPPPPNPRSLVGYWIGPEKIAFEADGTWFEWTETNGQLTAKDRSGRYAYNQQTGELVMQFYVDGEINRVTSLVRWIDDRSWRFGEGDDAPVFRRYFRPR